AAVAGGGPGRRRSPPPPPRSSPPPPAREARRGSGRASAFQGRRGKRGCRERRGRCGKLIWNATSVPPSVRGRFRRCLRKRRRAARLFSRRSSPAPEARRQKGGPHPRRWVFEQLRRGVRGDGKLIGITLYYIRNSRKMPLNFIWKMALSGCMFDGRG